MQELPLKKEQQRRAVIFTVADGACQAWAVHLYCTGKYSVSIFGLLTTMSSLSECKTNYHNNFSVCGGVRTYYGGIPDAIQVGEHQFVEASLINTWIDLMLTAW
jgi:hypothetical protein